MNFINKWKEENINSCIILSFILLMGMCYRYVEFTKGWELVLIFLFAQRFLLSNNFLKSIFEENILKICIMIYAALVLVNIIYTRKFEFLFDNMWKIVCTNILIFLIYGMKKMNNDSISRVMAKGFLVLNVFWIANLFVLGMQITGSGFMIKDKWLATNSFYLDQCCGLFGNSGTHELGFFAVFMLIYNLVYVVKCKSSVQKKGIFVYTLVTQMIMLFLSTKNDNIALFVLIPMFAAVFLLCMLQWSNVDQNLRKKIYITGMVSFLVIILLLLLIPYTREFILENVVFRIKKVFLLSSSSIIGSNERLAIPLFGLQNKWGWGLGKGLGAWLWHRGGFLDFPHFGLSSVGSFINLGGIWFYLAQTALYAVICFKLCYPKKNTKKGMIFLLLSFFIMLAVSIYTNVYTSNISTIWVVLTFLMFGELKKHMDVCE